MQGRCGPGRLRVGRTLNEDASTGEASCYGELSRIVNRSAPRYRSTGYRNEAAQILIFNQLAEVGVDVVGVDDEGLA